MLRRHREVLHLQVVIGRHGADIDVPAHAEIKPAGDISEQGLASDGLSGLSSRHRLMPQA